MLRLVMLQIVSGVDTFLNILSVVLIVYALMTWFMRPDNPVYMILARIADVVLTPFRPLSAWLFRKGLRMDMTVWLALIAILILRALLSELIYSVVF